MRELYLTYLNRLDVEAAALADEEIIAAIEAALAMQGRGETVIEPRVHLEPNAGAEGHFNVLRGAIGGAIGLAGVKVVGDFVGNYTQDLPSELGLLCLFDPGTGAPVAVIDASGITDMRTGAVTAVGAKYLAPGRPKILGHIGARGTAYWNVRLLDRLLGFEEIRVHSRRAASRDEFARRLTGELGKRVVATADWRSCVEGADIVVEASRLSAPEPLLRTDWIKPGALVIPYGTMSAVELSLTDIMSKIVVDDWASAAAASSAHCVPTSRRASSPRTRCTPNLARSSPGSGQAGSARTRRSCSGTGACRSRTSHSATRSWPKPPRPEPGNGSVTRDRKGLAGCGRGCALSARGCGDHPLWVVRAETAGP